MTYDTGIWKKLHNKEEWIVTKYPFFGLYIVKRQNSYGRIVFVTNHKEYSTLHEAKEQAVLAQIKKCQNNEPLFYYSANAHVGAGKYYAKDMLCKKYHWLYPKNMYGLTVIRFSRNVSIEKILQIGEKIKNRHYKRFLQEFLNPE